MNDLSHDIAADASAEPAHLPAEALVALDGEIAAPGIKFPNEISETIWNMKYRLKTPEQRQGDTIIAPEVLHDVTVEDTWARVAKALASVESDNMRPFAEARFYRALENWGYLPAGRITSGSGTDRDVTLFNCFVMGTVADSMPGIFDALKEAALTMQAGGGIGYDFSTLRPEGAPVLGVGSDASGPLSFMNVWDAMCRTIMSAGSRRGAMMATMRCDHPDIEKFITAKQDAAKLRMFNVSVLVTDAFMEAVKADAPWDLVFGGKVYRTVRARDLWDLIMKSTYDFAEPGVLFIDRINRLNPLTYCETIASTNPCGEQPLPPHGACLLGSVNLARLVVDAFDEEARIDEARLEELVADAVRMMDNVVDISLFPLPQQLAEAKAKRRIGLGVTGLADALVMLKIKYGSAEAQAQTRAWMRKIFNAAYRASVELAKEKGAFPLFDAEKYLASPTIQKLDDDVKAGIAEFGIRNALLTSIAPTGTISLYAGNISSGIEPIFATSYERKVLLPDGSHHIDEVVDYAVQVYRQKFGATSDAELPDYFVTAQTLTPLQHVGMQAAAQEWVDSSISKTTNVSADIPFGEFKEVYMAAWDQGCKGCTTYRPNAVTGSVLTVKEEPKALGPVPYAAYTEPTKRPAELEGATKAIRWAGNPHTFFVTVNHTQDEFGRNIPFEVFVQTQDQAHTAWVAALTRMISAVFRRGGDVSFVAEELKAIVDPRGGNWVQGTYVPSLVALIGHVIYDRLVKIGYIGGDKVPVAKAPAEATIEDVSAEEVAAAMAPTAEEPAAPALPEIMVPPSMLPYLDDPCGECGKKTLQMKGGCPVCENCWNSKCG